MMYIAVTAIAIALSSFQVVAAHYLSHQSLNSPYLPTPQNQHYTPSGAATVHKNFIRLTPDRAGRRGYIWTDKTVGESVDGTDTDADTDVGIDTGADTSGADTSNGNIEGIEGKGKTKIKEIKELSAVLNFRISGQSPTLYGDGIGLWLTTLKSPLSAKTKKKKKSNGDVDDESSSEIHGVTNMFTGIGVIVDTYKNKDSQLKHRDVNVIVNNAENGPYSLNDVKADVKTDDVMMTGCNLRADERMRYHEGSAFDVGDMSRIRVIVNETTAIVEIDANNKNEWRMCTTVPKVNEALPADWMSGARFGISGTTGDLADNHDIISLDVHDSRVESEIFAVKQHSKLSFTSTRDSNDSNDSIGVNDDNDNKDNKERKYQHEIEHRLIKAEEKISNLNEKYKKLEAEVNEHEKVNALLTNTIQQIVTKSTKKMEAAASASRSEIETKKYEQRLDLNFYTLQHEIEQAILEMKNEVAVVKIEGKGWIKPLLMVLFLVVLGGGYFIRMVNGLTKRHLL